MYIPYALSDMQAITSMDMHEWVWGLRTCVVNWGYVCPIRLSTSDADLSALSKRFPILEFRHVRPISIKTLEPPLTDTG